MKTQLYLFVLLLISVSGMITGYTQGEKKPRTDADYSVRTLSELTTLQPDYMADKPQLKDENRRIVVHADPLPSTHLGQQVRFRRTNSAPTHLA